MLQYRASALINAKPATIWSLLSDTEGYPTWDPGIDHIEGTIALGNKITVYTKVSPNRAFPVKVTTLEPARRMVWTGGMPLGLFKGERTFLLTPQPEGGTLFTTQERFSGPLLPLISKTMPDLSEDFERFVQGLKAKAESLPAPRESEHVHTCDEEGNVQ